MATILILYRDESTRDGLATEVRCLGHDVIKASKPARAVEALKAERVEVMIAEMGTSLRGLDAVTFVAEVSPRTRTILTSEDATATDYKSAVERGATDVLNVPLVPGELERAIQRALERSDGFHGNLHGLDLTDIIQVFHQARRTLVVRLGADGEIHMLDGEVIHASAPPLQGRVALKSLLARRSGAVDTRSAEICPRTVDDAFQPLLLDLMRELDEERVGTGPKDLRLGPAPLSAAPEDVPTNPARKRSAKSDAETKGASKRELFEEELVDLEPEDLTTEEEIAPATPALAGAVRDDLDELTGPPRREAPATLPQSSFHGLPLRKARGSRRAERAKVATPTRTAATLVERPSQHVTHSPLFWGLLAGVLTMAGALVYASLDRGQRVELTRLPPASEQPAVESLKPLQEKAAVRRVQVAPRKATKRQGRRAKAAPRKRAKSRAPRSVRVAVSSPKVDQRAQGARVVPRRAPQKHASRGATPPAQRRPAIGLLE